jgi:hypothetical protein
MGQWILEKEMTTQDFEWGVLTEEQKQFLDGAAKMRSDNTDETYEEAYAALLKTFSRTWVNMVGTV